MRAFIVLLIYLLMSNAPVSADTPSAWQLCAGGTQLIITDQMISSCTAVIDGGRETGKRLVTAHLHRAVAYFERRQFDEAIADLSRAIAVRPADRFIFKIRAVVFERMGRFDRAIADLDHAVALKPDDVVSYIDRAKALDLGGRFDRAAADWSRVIESWPSFSFAFAQRCRGRALADRDLVLALADCNRALDLQPDAGTFEDRGLVYFRMKKFDAAIADYNAALQVDRGAVASLYLRGVARRQAGDISGGDRDIRLAVAADPDVGSVFAAHGIL